MHFISLFLSQLIERCECGGSPDALPVTRPDESADCARSGFQGGLQRQRVAGNRPRVAPLGAGFPAPPAGLLPVVDRVEDHRPQRTEPTRTYDVVRVDDPARAGAIAFWPVEHARPAHLDP